METIDIILKKITFIQRSNNLLLKIIEVYSSYRLELIQTNQKKYYMVQFSTEKLETNNIADIKIFNHLRQFASKI